LEASSVRLKHETFGHKKDESIRKKIKYIIDTIQKSPGLSHKKLLSVSLRRIYPTI
jgi:hypothetical protein